MDTMPAYARNAIANQGQTAGMDATDKMLLAGGLGGLGAGLGAYFFGNQNNPYESANQYYNQIPGQVKPLYAPYQQAGQQALSQLPGQYASLLNDPSALYNKIAGGYHQSPGYQWALNQALMGANNAAAAGGMLGSPEHQQQAAAVAEGLANQDYMNYLKTALPNATGMFGAGLQGLEGLNKMGYGANEQMAALLSDYLTKQGDVAFKNEAAQNQSQGQEWGNIFGGLGALLPTVMSFF